MPRLGSGEIQFQGCLLNPAMAICTCPHTPQHVPDRDKILACRSYADSYAISCEMLGKPPSECNSLWLTRYNECMGWHGCPIID